MRQLLLLTLNAICYDFNSVLTHLVPPLQQNIQLKFQEKIWSWVGNVLLMLSSWIHFSWMTAKVLNFNSVFVNINCNHKRHTHFKFVPSNPTDKSKEIIPNHSKAVIMNFWTVITTWHTSTYRHLAPTYTFKIPITFSTQFMKNALFEHRTR
jgi:hypothetical protein